MELIYQEATTSYVDGEKMRFSAVQEEDEYEVGLGQENLARDGADEGMRAAAREALVFGKSVDDSSTAYCLPLLFANGYPTSLDQISVTELERFITFMVECSSGPLQTGAPRWWPKDIKFSKPFVRPKRINDNWMGTLKKLVFKCYTYHKSEYLLRFCSYLAQYPREKLYYLNNYDSTTSLYHKGTGRLLATFRNVNMDYDKIVDSPRRSLLPQNHGASKVLGKPNKSGEQKQRTKDQSSLVVIQPVKEEIYLCDNCDAEFGDLDQMKDHEKICSEPVSAISSRPVTPYEPIIEPELDQNKFLDYFKLSGSTAPKSTTSRDFPAPTIHCEPLRATRRLRTAVNLTRCPTIPLSSPAGLIMLKKSKTMTESIQQERLDRIERHLNAPPLNKFSRPKWLDRHVEYNRWMISYKPSKEKSAQTDYAHKYTFGAFKRKPALSLKSQLLYIACGSCHVKLERLSPEKLEDLKSHPWKYRPPAPRRPPRPRPGPLSKMNPGLALKRKLAAESPRHPHPKRMSTLLRALDKQPKPTLLHNPVHRRSDTEKIITLVNLCSSDEEDDTWNITRLNSDENRDPMSSSENPSINYFKTISLSPSNPRTRSLGYQGTSVNDWLRRESLTKDERNSKFLGHVIDTPKTYASLLKQTP
uniref:p3A2_0 protein n=1 Tax=Fopius arisanus TaxID=64838 RepID=A0A0C9R0L8_9HYME